ncbi:MAG: hypothetical protein ACREB7_05045 [Sphingopyxis sp.]|jgi:hypothetical protein|uniref:hypothetical protein n=1 Tax=Sphingopyxis sp. TaxID=1908224 RepID=UPI003D6D15FE
MEGQKLLQLAGLIFVVLVVLVVFGLVLNIAISIASILLVVAVIAGLYFLAERLFGKRR